MLNSTAAPRRARIIQSLWYMLEFSWRQTLIEYVYFTTVC